MNFSIQIHESCWSTALFYCNVYIWFWYKDDTRPHRWIELNNSTASTFRRKFRLLLNYFFHKYLVEASVETL